MLGVIVQEDRKTFLDQRFVHLAGGGEPALEELARTMTDHDADAGFRYRRPPEPDQRVVERGGQIRAGVDQRAVEVESDAVKGYNLGHRRGDAVGTMVLARPTCDGPVIKPIFRGVPWLEHPSLP